MRIMPSTTPVANPPGGPTASAVLQALRAQGVDHLVTVPDYVQFALHHRLQQPDCGLRTVYAASEDQALTLHAGLYVAGVQSALLMQNQGLYKCANTLRAVCVDAGIPAVFLVGQFGREPENFGQDMRQSRRSLVRLMPPFVEAFGLPHWTVEDDAGLGVLEQAFTHARTHETAAIVLLARHVTWS